MDDPLHGRTVLVVDDDPQLLALVEQMMARAGARAILAEDGHAGLRLFYEHRPDLVILDIMMPGLDGREVCRRLRELSDVPVLMLTALDEPGEIAASLGDGADDYVSKPFYGEVLLARLRALLRRAARPSPAGTRRAYDDGYLAIDLDGRRVHVRGEPVSLTPTEYELLRYLYEHAGRVLSYPQILSHVWGPEFADSTQYVHVYVHRLRQRLCEDPAHPRYLVTEPGVGYRLELYGAQR
jgi:two-component system KDP operon response regulator KdpE